MRIATYDHDTSDWLPQAEGQTALGAHLVRVPRWGDSLWFGPRSVVLVSSLAVSSSAVVVGR